MDNYFQSTLDDKRRWECVEELEDLVTESDDDVLNNYRSNSKFKTKMDNYFRSTLDDVRRWECVEELEDLITESDNDVFSNYRSQQTVHSQRDYICLYGSYPKMEDRIYSYCNVCEQAFNPRAVASHKETCPDKQKVTTTKAAMIMPLPPLFKESTGPSTLSKFLDILSPQVSRLVPDVLSFEPVASSSKVTVDIEPVSTPVATPVPPPPPPVPIKPPSPILVPETISTDDNSIIVNNIRHKKTKKNTKAFKYDPNVHCGVVEGQKGPCTRSITCSTHKLQLRKSVTGRSKNIHVLIAEKNATTETDNNNYISTTTIEEKLTEFPFINNIEQDNDEDDELKQDIMIIDDVEESQIISKPITIKTERHEKELHDEVESDDPSNNLESGYCSIETSFSTKNSPVLYYNPISPIIVVTPLQFIQKENTVFVEAPQRAHNPPTNGYFLTIPETTNNIKLYKSHPKPTILPTFGTRKVGGAILSSYKRLEYQRNDIQEAINSNKIAPCSTTSFVPPQRSILLKTKNINKVNFKRTSTDKLSVSDNSKQIKLAADVNGFILHTEMSEVAETPQSNHCIQENINLLNMK